MFVKFVKDDKTIEEVSISSEMIPFPTDIVVLEAGKFTVESREYDILDGTCTVILDQQITWTSSIKSIVMQCLHTGSVGIIQLICHVKTSLR